jgi:hypothetical protein
MHHQWSRYAKEFRDDLHDIEQPLIMIPNRRFDVRTEITLSAPRPWPRNPAATVMAATAI